MLSNAGRELAGAQIRLTRNFNRGDIVPSYDGKMSIVCGDVLGGSLFACASMAEGATNPSAMSTTARPFRNPKRFRVRGNVDATMRTRTKSNRMCILFASHTAALLDAGRVRCGFTAYRPGMRRMENGGGVSRVPWDAEFRAVKNPTGNLAPIFVFRRL